MFAAQIASDFVGAGMNRKISFGICVTVGASLLIGLAAAGAGEETSCDTSLKPGEQCWQGTMHSEATGHHGERCLHRRGMGPSGENISWRRWEGHRRSNQ